MQHLAALPGATSIHGIAIPEVVATVTTRTARFKESAHARGRARAQPRCKRKAGAVDGPSDQRSKHQQHGDGYVQIEDDPHNLLICD